MEEKEVQAVQLISTRLKNVETRLEWSLSKQIIEAKIKSNTSMISPNYDLQFGNETTSWKMKLGTNKKDNNYLSFHLNFGYLNDPENREVSSVVSMKTEEGKLVSSHKFTVMASVPLKSSGFGYGFSKFAQISDLIYVNEKLTLVCDLVVPVESNKRIRIDTEEKVKYDSRENESLFLENMKSMYNLSSFSDLTIFCGDQKFLCHKIVLASRSDVFKDLLGSVESELEITDSSPDIFKSVIDHIYTGKIPKDTSTNATELFRLAMKYNLQILAKACEIILLERLSDNNATDTLITLDTHKSTSNAKNEVMKYIAVNATDIMDTEKFKEFAKEHPDLMLEVYRCSILNQKKEVLETVRKEGTSD